MSSFSQVVPNTSKVPVPTGSLACCEVAFREPTSDLATIEAEHLAAKVRRAESSGPRHITKEAAVAEINRDGTITTLREGKNNWVCFPGNENEIGNVPMCCDPMGLQWIRDALASKPAPTNTAPGLIYMLAGAVQHSSTDPFDRTSRGIPIGPHYMILWPFDAKRDGFPTTMRDAGALVMFDGTPYAHLHICGDPWEGKDWKPEEGTEARWTMRYT